MIDINNIEISSFLAKLGIYPKFKQGNDLAYYSPFRSEKKPSFFVNESRNCWFDFGVSGNTDYGLIGFIKLYYNIDSFKECLNILAEVMELPSQDIKCPSKEARTVLELISEEDITDNSVIEYIKSRKVSLTTTKRYLKQCRYKFYDQEKLGLSYDNYGGGKEILGLDGMKCSLKTKSFTLIPGVEDYCVTEGFFDTLSYLYAIKKRKSSRNIIVLNSVTNVKKAIEIIEPLAKVHLYLDNDSAGVNCAKILKSRFRCVDHSLEYKGFKDLNEFLIT